MRDPIKAKESKVRYSKTDKFRECQKRYQNTTAGRISRAYITYKHRALKMGLPFDFTKEMFTSMWNGRCEYCGDTIDGLGLDRVDNSGGYEINNVVLCCSDCNYMKRMMTKEGFINHIRKILGNMEKQNG